MEGLRFSKLMSSSYCLSRPSQAVPTALVHLLSQLPRTVLREVQVDSLVPQYGFSWLHGLPWWLKQLTICPQCRTPGFDPWVGKIPWRRERLPAPVFWPGESPWTEKPGRMQSMGCRVGQDWATKHSTAHCNSWALAPLPLGDKSVTLTRTLLLPAGPWHRGPKRLSGGVA